MPNITENTGSITLNLLNEEEMQKYLAAYLNMANHNFFVTLLHIGRTVGAIRPKDVHFRRGSQEVDLKADNEKDIPNMALLYDKLRPEQEEKARLMVFAHFPFMKYLGLNGKRGQHNPNANAQDWLSLKNILKKFAYILDNQRNYYTHAVRIKSNNLQTRNAEQSVGKNLWELNSVSCDIIKDRFGANNNPNQQGMLTENSLDFITQGKLLNDANMNPSYFLCPLYKSHNNADVLPDGKNPLQLTTVGLIQFTCLFLEKKYITEFLSQCHLLDSISNDSTAPELSQRRLILEFFSILRIRLPRRKLEMVQSRTTIALDMLNELKKCPEEVFDLLSAKDKARFEVSSAGLAETESGGQILLKRTSDRFPVLALRYFDSTPAFNELRFQTNMGIFRYLENANSDCIDGLKRMRVLEEPLNGFGRVDELEKIRIGQLSEASQIWPGFKILTAEDSPCNDTSKLPFIRDVHTKYVFDGDNINMAFSDLLPKIIDKGKGKYHVSCPKADCSISRFELPAMLFYHLLTKKPDGTSLVEQLIIKTVKDYKRLFTDINEDRLTPDVIREESNGDSLNAQKMLDIYLKEKYGISLRDIPEKIRDYLLGLKADNNLFTKHKATVITELKADTKRRQARLQRDLKAVNDRANLPGQGGYVRIKPGSLASFLVKDIVFFQDCSDPKKALSGQDYNVLQACMALFSGAQGHQLKNLKDTFIKAGLISTTKVEGEDTNEAGGTNILIAGTHPFLHKVVSDENIKDTVGLYSKYLEERGTYLESDIPDNAAFLHQDREKWKNRDGKYYKELAKRYLEAPVMLPRRLFEEPIRTYLSSFLEGDKASELRTAVTEAQNKGRCNTAFMIDKYFSIYREDAPQCFYREDEMPRDGYQLYSLVKSNKAAAEELKGNKENDNSSEHRNLVKTLELALSKAVAGSMAQTSRQDRGSETAQTSRQGLKLEQDAKTDQDTMKLERSIISACKEYCDTEKTIRRYSVQDELLFMTAMDCIQGELGNPDGTLKLQGITPDDENVLDQAIDIKTEVQLKKNQKATILQEGVKIKDYGEIYKLLNDKRVEQLLRFNPDREIKSTLLAEEIKKYDELRTTVFSSLIGYERMVLKRANINEPPRNNEDPSKDKNYIPFETVLKKDRVTDEKDQKILRTIRNAFCHNDYPEKSFEGVNIHDGRLPGLAEQPMLAERIVREMIRIIENYQTETGQLQS